LVYLGTTSLYAHGSSQYERIQLPEGVISSQQAQLQCKRSGLKKDIGTAYSEIGALHLTLGKNSNLSTVCATISELHK
jgi:hypothetical protein